MRRRVNSTVWVLGTLLVLAGIIGFEVVRAQLTGEAPPPARLLTQSADPTFKAGEFAPDFTLRDRRDRQHSLKEMVRGDTFVFFSCACAACEMLMTYTGTLYKKMADMKQTPPAVVTVTTMSKDAEDSWIRRTNLPQSIVYERKNGPVMETYRGHPCPRVYRVDKDLRVVWFSPNIKSMQDPSDLGDAVGAQLGFPPAITQGQGNVDGRAPGR